jgi:phosphatidylglycerophosphatase A
MDRLIVAIATGLYSGMLPKAPGTWGTLFGLIPWYFCRNLALPVYLGVIGALFVIGSLVAGSAEKIFDRPDPGIIVIDEIVGLFVALTLAPKHPLAWVLGFLLFRLFDVLKPFPINWLDSHLHGGIGIMVDDVVAGIYALICLQVIWLVVGRLL